MELKGKVTDGEYTYQRKTYVKPTTHYYGMMSNGQPSVKYSCPVCEALNNRFSFPYGMKNCPQCNVNLIWEEVT